jgi:hypothetical protein
MTIVLISTLREKRKKSSYYDTKGKEDAKDA